MRLDRGLMWRILVWNAALFGIVVAALFAFKACL